MSQFKQGQKLKAIYIPGGEFYRVGDADITEITVVMENGQCDGVPWFEVEINGVVVYKFNGALIEGVALLD